MFKYYCINFLFYIFLSGAILFSILGLLTLSGNVALLVENQQLDEKEKPIKEPDLKKRVTLQYFIAALLDFFFSMIFLHLVCGQKKAMSKNNNYNFPNPHNNFINDGGKNTTSKNENDTNTKEMTEKEI